MVMKKLLHRLSEFHKNVISLNERNRNYVNLHNPRKFYHLADDKSVCKEVLEKNSIPTPSTYAIVHSMGEIHKKLEEVKDKQSMVIKPTNGSRGDGIMILKKNGLGEWMATDGNVVSKSKIVRHISNILFGVYSFDNESKALIEYYIKQHPIFNQIFPGGIFDLRIIIHKKKPVMGMLRIPTSRSHGKANLHQGAIGVAVDMQNGVLGEGFNGSNYLSEHPDTGFSFKDVKIPGWEEVIEICKKTAYAFPLDYLGIDIVFDEYQGPMVIEINVRPGLQIQNVNKQGLKNVISGLDG